MYRTFRMLIVSVALYAVWTVPGRAFQLFGGDQTPQTVPATSLESGPVLPSAPALELGDGGDLEPGDDRMNIWIPGLGVVGKMPKLDFGLEMLYGAQDTPEEAPPAAHELKEFESDFAIKGTIKRKF